MSRPPHGSNRRARHDSGVSSLSSHSRGGQSPDHRNGRGNPGRGSAGPGRGGFSNRGSGRNPRLSQSDLARIARISTYHLP